MSAQDRVAIVGGGWAGLACAAELAAAGIAVTVFEAARQLGGRARGVELEGQQLDNGQHLIVGAYRETLRLMRLVGADPDCCFSRRPLHVEIPGSFRLRLPRLPAPFHLLFGLLGAQGAGLGEKLRAARFMQRLQRNGYRLDEDTTVARWLDAHGQTGALRRHLWEPLCLAALNTPPADASAQVFANVLRDSLGGGREDTDLLLPRGDLGELFPEPAAAFIAARGGEIRLSARVTAIDRDDAGWQLVSGGTERFDQVVVAVAPQHLPPLLVGRPQHEAQLLQLADYHYEPIATAYLAYPPQVTLPAPMLGMPGPLGQWVFDRGVAGGNPGIIAFVLSASGEWDDLDNGELADRLHRELTTLIGPLPDPLWDCVIRERRATFACRPGTPRPGPATSEAGLWLAGDYTYDDYPATLEGAVRSGVAAAQAVRGVKVTLSRPA